MNQMKVQISLMYFLHRSSVLSFVSDEAGIDSRDIFKYDVVTMEQ